MSSHSFNHRRYNSEPLVAHTLSKNSFDLALLAERAPRNAPRPISTFPTTLASPAAVHVRLQPQFSIQRPRPKTEIFNAPPFPPIIPLGSPRQPHLKTRISQPVLKLTSIKERLEHLETTNEHLQQRIESYKTDVEMLSSSVTYFSSEYYAGLLVIRDLRARSKQDAEILSAQEQQLCQLKKFVGLMVEIGLHEPVLARAHGEVLKGQKDFDSTLVEAIRTAAARPGSAWAGILSAAARGGPRPDCAPTVEVVASLPVPTPEAHIDAHDAANPVDDLLHSLKNGDIPFGRHRSASQRFGNKSPACIRPVASRSTLQVKSPKISKPASSSPARSPLRKLDGNRTPQSNKTPNRINHSAIPSSKPPTPKNPSSTTQVKEDRADPSRPGTTKNVAQFSTDRALASLQRILDHFSSGSFGSLGTTTEGTQSTECDGSAETGPAKSPIRICVRPPTSCAVATSPARKGTHLSTGFSPTIPKNSKGTSGKVLGSPRSPASPLWRYRPAQDAAVSPLGKKQRIRAAGWR